jgi:hypothetical protein
LSGRRANRSRIGAVSIYRPAFAFWHYPEFVLKNVMMLPGDVAVWLRATAARENTSVSRLVTRILELQMRRSDDYMDAYRQWQALAPLDVDASTRLGRDEAHER